ncbi:MAG: hypothetical protein JEZ14_19950 [Marinilabiliaceae bacterium]|nr:hypothetical protein [Marinilabiliaceae bacterium]
MKKIELKDVSFLIPVRIDSGERMENLHLVLEFLNEFFDTNIILLEADTNEKVFHSCITEKIFIEDHEPVFHRTKYLNQMTLRCQTCYVAIWDADVLVAPDQINKAVQVLQQGKADMAFPYDGHFYKMPRLFTNIYKKRLDVNDLEKNKSKFRMPAGSFSVGGAFLINRDKYIEAGMENESFYGWGSEDIERVKRMEILGYKVQRVKGALFHLFHPIHENSWFFSKESEIRSRRLLINTCKMHQTELQNHVKTWKIKK